MSIENTPGDQNDYLQWLEEQDLQSTPTVEEIVALEMKDKFDATREVRLDECKDKFVRTTTISGESYVYNPISVIASGILFAVAKNYSDQVAFRLVKGSLLMSHENWQADKALNNFYINTVSKVTDQQQRRFEIDGMYSCVATFGSFVENGYLATHVACAPEDKEQYYRLALMDPAYTVELAVPIGTRFSTVCVDRRLFIEPDKIILAEVV
jgi:hypothetical protein